MDKKGKYLHIDKNDNWNADKKWNRKPYKGITELKAFHKAQKRKNEWKHIQLYKENATDYINQKKRREKKERMKGRRTNARIT